MVSSFASSVDFQPFFNSKSTHQHIFFENILAKSMIFSLRIQDNFHLAAGRDKLVVNSLRSPVNFLDRPRH